MQTRTPYHIYVIAPPSEQRRIHLFSAVDENLRYAAVPQDLQISHLSPIFHGAAPLPGDIKAVLRADDGGIVLQKETAHRYPA